MLVCFELYCASFALWGFFLSYKHLINRLLVKLACDCPWLIFPVYLWKIVWLRNIFFCSFNVAHFALSIFPAFPFFIFHQWLPHCPTLHHFSRCLTLSHSFHFVRQACYLIFFHVIDKTIIASQQLVWSCCPTNACFRYAWFCSLGSLELWTALVIRRTQHTSHFQRMSLRRSFTLVWRSRWVTETRHISLSKSSIPRRNEAHSRCLRMVTSGNRTGTNRRTRLITFTAVNARVITGKQPSHNRPAAGSMSRLLQRFDCLHSRRKIHYFCFVAEKVKKTPKKKLPDNNLKVSAPTVFTYLKFLKTQNSDLCSIKKFSSILSEYWEKNVTFTSSIWLLIALPGFVVYCNYSSVE